MHEVSLSTTPSRLPAAVPPPKQGLSATSFQDLLASLKRAPGDAPASPAMRVRPGECLSTICADQLRDQGAAVTQRSIHAAVQLVATANHIPDPNRIYPGQRLVLSMLGGSTTLPARPNPSPGKQSPKPWQSLVDGAVALSSPFGLRSDPFTGRVQQHNGIDVAAPFGAKVSAFAPGTVSFSGWKPGYGNLVIIRHEGGLESLYAHLSRSLVEVGQAVASHLPIACVGSSGRSTGPHLYFEVRSHGKAIDPIPQISLSKTGF